MPDPRVAALLEPATHRLVRSVDAMTDADWAGPSLLPGWTRAHVVAHLTLNAEGLSSALDGVHEGLRTPMYASQQDRDQDIETLADRPVGEIRDRFLGSTTVIADRVTELAENLESASIERVPGGRTILAGQVGDMRVREVEIHHVDLGLTYAASDWSTDFVTLLLDARAAAWVGGSDAPGFTAYAEDLGRRWAFGSGGSGGSGGTGEPGSASAPRVVSGPGVLLAWWSTGRGTGEGLASDSGALPQIGAW